MEVGIFTIAAIAVMSAGYALFALAWLRKNRPQMAPSLADEIARCEGRDNPDERCPRRPADCICWTHDHDGSPRKA